MFKNNMLFCIKF